MTRRPSIIALGLAMLTASASGAAAGPLVLVSGRWDKLPAGRAPVMRPAGDRGGARSG